nr:receptor-like cytosolic serine/threonine-protein kinase RBK2 [Ipomoea trifida]
MKAVSFFVLGLVNLPSFPVLGVKMVNSNSPDTVLEDYLNGLVSETDTTKSSILEFESESYEKRNSKWEGFLQLFRDKFKKRHFGSLDPLSSLKISKRFSCSMREAACGSGLLQSPILEGGLSCFKPQWKNFSLSEIEIATNNFHHGRLRDGKLVAVKRLTRGAPEERIGDFLSELGIMAHLNHPNTTKLIGYGVEGGYYLVLELSPHGSLASMLHGIRYVAALDFSLSYCLFFLSIYLSTVFTVSKQKPGWYIRYKVALGTAKGLQYLHEGCQRRIIHRDIKAANILLMEDFEPQLDLMWDCGFMYMSASCISFSGFQSKTFHTCCSCYRLLMRNGKLTNSEALASLLKWTKCFIGLGFPNHGICIGTGNRGKTLACKKEKGLRQGWKEALGRPYISYYARSVVPKALGLARS